MTKKEKKKQPIPYNPVYPKHITLVRPYKPTEASLGERWLVRLLDEKGKCLNSWSFKKRNDALSAHEHALDQVGQKFIEAKMNEFENYYNQMYTSTIEEE